MRIEMDDDDEPITDARLRVLDAGYAYYDERGVLRIKGLGLRDAIVADIARRAALIAPQLPADPDAPVPSPKIAPSGAAPAPRWGGCACCTEPLPPHLGGMCMLCCAALRQALRDAGRLE